MSWLIRRRLRSDRRERSSPEVGRGVCEGDTDFPPTEEFPTKVDHTAFSLFLGVGVHQENPLPLLYFGVKSEQSAVSIYRKHRYFFGTFTGNIRVGANFDRLSADQIAQCRAGATGTPNLCLQSVRNPFFEVAPSTSTRGRSATVAAWRMMELSRNSTPGSAPIPNPWAGPTTTRSR
jgi:hypothetical protein